MKESRYGRGLGTMKTIFGPGIESAFAGPRREESRSRALPRGVPVCEKAGAAVRGTDYKDTAREDRF
jgi:hypothetical protein